MRDLALSTNPERGGNRFKSFSPRETEGVSYGMFLFFGGVGEVELSFKVLLRVVALGGFQMCDDQSIFVPIPMALTNIFIYILVG